MAALAWALAATTLALAALLAPAQVPALLATLAMARAGLVATED